MGTYWIAPDGMQGEFVMDIGSVNFPVFGVELINTVNCQNDGCTNTPYSRDRAARAFKVVLRSAPSVSQPVFIITEKAPTRAFSWLKAPMPTQKS